MRLILFLGGICLAPFTGGLSLLATLGVSVIAAMEVARSPRPVIEEDDSPFPDEVWRAKQDARLAAAREGKIARYDERHPLHEQYRDKTLNSGPYEKLNWSVFGCSNSFCRYKVALPIDQRHQCPNCGQRMDNLGYDR